MTGLDMIVAALVAGAGVGAGDAAKAAVLDAYTGLRDLLRARLGNSSQVAEIIDAQETDQAVWQAGLGSHLAASGADQDDEILAAARNLLELADPAGTEAGKYRFDLRGAQHLQIGDNNVRIENSFGPTAGTMSGPVTVAYPGALPVPPPLPEA